MLFFFNVTATTGTYTYLHTLPLHDALPFSLPCTGNATSPPPLHHGAPAPRKRAMHRKGRQHRRTGGAPRRRRRSGRIDSATLPRPGSRAGFDTTVSGTRSEEHTSELQYLMRISYAVFCLKTKTPDIE